MLRQKEAIRILEATEQRGYEPRERDLKRVRGGLLVQEPDRIDSERETMQRANRSRARASSQWDDLWFAWKVCRHVRSNAIVIAKDGATIGDRRGADEPRRLGADRDREGARRARRRRG